MDINPDNRIHFNYCYSEKHSTPCDIHEYSTNYKISENPFKESHRSCGNPTVSIILILFLVVALLDHLCSHIRLASSVEKTAYVATDVNIVT